MLAVEGQGWRLADLRSNSAPQAGQADIKRKQTYVCKELVRVVEHVDPVVANLDGA